MKPGASWPDVGGSQIIGQSGTQDRQRQTGDHLVAEKRQAHQAVNSGQRGTEESPGQESQNGGTREFGDQKGGQGAHQHDPLHPEIQDPGPLGENFSQGGEQNRCSGLNGCGQQRHQHVRVHVFLRSASR